MHIGTEKTGTTTLQKTFFKNYDLLKEHGILYPKSFGISNHVGFCVCFQSIASKSELNAVVNAGMEEQEILQYKQRTLQRLKKEILESNCDTVTISNEHLHSRITSENEVREIKNWLQEIFGDEIYIVCYLRKQSELAVSHFSTAIKSGSTDSVLSLPIGAKPHYYDYKKMLEMWEKYFPHIICKEYNLDKLRNRDIVDDFLLLLHIDLNNDDFQSIQNANVSLDGKAIEVLALLNQEIPLLKEDKINPEREYLVRFFEKIPVKKKLTVNSQQLQAFQKQFDSDNRYIAKKFCKSERLFDTFVSKSENYTFGLEKEDVAYVFSELWKVTTEHVKLLEARNLYLNAESSFLKNNLGQAILFVRQSLKISKLPKAVELENNILYILDKKQNRFVFGIGHIFRYLRYKCRELFHFVFCSIACNLGRWIKPLIIYFVPSSHKNIYHGATILVSLKECASHTVCETFSRDRLTHTDIPDQLLNNNEKRYTHGLNESHIKSLFSEFWSLLSVHIKSMETKNSKLKREISFLKKQI